MAKRDSTNRRLSRSSRHTGSGILDPDTDVVGDAYPYWWKNLENNTTALPSINDNILNETSQHLDSNSQIEASKEVDEWWKVLDMSDSSKSGDHKSEQRDLSKYVVETSESEEEPQIKKRKLPLRLKTKTKQNNVFLNILNNAKETSATESISKTRENSSIKNFESNAKTVTNYEQSSEMQDSNLNQNSNTNNVLKSKPNIFRRGCKSPSKNIFVDILQNSESQAPLQNKFVISESENQIDQTSCNVSEPIFVNHSSFSESTLILERIPQAHSTTLENASKISNNNDSSDNTEYEVLKRKPIFSKSRTDLKKDILENIFTLESNNEKEGNRSINENIIENVEGDKPSLVLLSNDLRKISNESKKNVASEDKINDAIGITILRSRRNSRSVVSAPGNSSEYIKRNPSRRNIFASNYELNSNLEMDNGVSMKSEMLLKQKYCNLSRRSVPNDNSESLRNSLKEKRRSHKICLPNKSIRNGENGKNVSKVVKKNLVVVLEDISKMLKKKEMTNKLQDAAEDDRNTDEFQRRSASNNSLNLNTEQSNSVKDASNLSSRVNNTPSSKRKNEKVDRNDRNVGFRGIRNVEGDGSEDNNDEQIPSKSYLIDKNTRVPHRKSAIALSTSNTKEESSRENRAILLSENSILAMGKIDELNRKQSNIGDKGVRDIEYEDLNDDSKGEETLIRTHRTGQNSNALDRKSVTAVSASIRKEEDNIEDFVKRSSRVSDVGSSVQKCFDSNVDITNKDASRGIIVVESKNGRIEEVSNELKHTDDNLSVFHRKSMNTLSTSRGNGRDYIKTLGRLSSRVSDSTLSLRKSNDIRTNITGKNANGESSSDVSTEDACNELQHSDQHRDMLHMESVNTPPPSIRSKHQTTAKNQSRLSFRSDHQMSSMKRSGHTIANVAESSNDASSEETSNELQHIDEHRSMLHIRGTSRSGMLATSMNTSRHPMANAVDRNVTVGSSNDASSEETSNEQQHIDHHRSMRHIKSVDTPFTLNTNEHENIQIRNSLSSRMDSLVSSMRRSRRTSKTSNLALSNNKKGNIDDESSNDIDTEKTSNAPHRIDEYTSTLHRKSLNTSHRKEHDNTQNRSKSSVVRNLASEMKEIAGTNINVSVSGNQGRREEMKESIPNEVSANEETPTGMQHAEKNRDAPQREFHANVSSTLRRKESVRIEDNSGWSNTARGLLSSRKSGTKRSRAEQSKGQQSIKNFFDSNRLVPASQVLLDEEKAATIKRKLERVKEADTNRVETKKKQRKTNTATPLRKPDKKRNDAKHARQTKQVHKAFLVNGQVYRVPRLPRPKPWITDRLYNYLWKRMEPKYNLETRAVSEKFIRDLSDIMTFIVKQKSYDSYKHELKALMKEMARHGIIGTRNDFYNFSYDFFPYELRVKVVPMLLPGGERNIPYHVDKLYKPLLDE